MAKPNCLLLAVFVVSCTSSYGIHPLSETIAPASVKFMTYNTHLFDAGGKIGLGIVDDFINTTLNDYLKKRDGSILTYFDEKRGAQIVRAIQSLGAERPDIVVLQEVWTERMKELFVNELVHIYPHYYRPEPDQINPKGKIFGSGLLLLSKYKILPDSIQFTPYENLQDEEAYTVKGIAQATIQLGKSEFVGVFFTHAAGGDNGASAGIWANLIKTYLAKNPTHGIILAGDLNAPDLKAESINLKDAFREKFSPEQNPGFTVEGTPLKEIFKGEKCCKGCCDERLDYVLYEGGSVISHVAKAQVNHERFYFDDQETGQRLPLSDHYPVFVDLGVRH